MIRDDKVKLVEQMHERFSATPHAVLAAYSGLTVNSVNELRRKVDGIGGNVADMTGKTQRAAGDIAAVMGRFLSMIPTLDGGREEERETRRQGLAQRDLCAQRSVDVGNHASATRHIS